MNDISEKNNIPNKNKKSPSIKKNFILSFLYEILAIIVPFITTPYASRILGAENIGIYSYTHSIQMYFSLFAVLGTASYGKREVARTRDSKELNTKFFWEIELLSVITSLISLTFWFIFINFADEYKLYYLILSLALLSKLFDISWFYKGLEQFKYTVIRNSVVKILGIVCLFSFVKSKNDLWIYFIFNTSIDLLANISMWFSLPKFLVKIKIKELRILPHFKETLVYFIPTIATSIYTVLDKTLIGLITKDPAQNGYYEQATKIINLVKTLCFSSINAIMGSRLAYLFEQGKIEEIKDKISKTMNFMLFLTIPCTFGLIGISQTFVPVFLGSGFEPTILLLQTLAPVLLITGLSTTTSSLYYIPVGKRIKTAIYIGIGAASNFILNIVLIPFLGAFGAIIGTLIAETIICILYLKNCDHFVNCYDLLKSSCKKIISSTFMFIYLLLIQKIKINIFVLLFTQILGGVLIYFTLLFILKDNTLSFLKNKIFKKKKG